MPKIHFPRAKIVALVEHVKKATDHYHPYQKLLNIKKEDIKPSLLLVGDQGIYFMSNGLPAMEKDDPNRVVYCKESDPTVLDFDTWYDNKRAIFGGDDGIEVIEVEVFEKSLTKGLNRDPKAKWFTMTLSSKGLRI